MDLFGLKFYAPWIIHLIKLRSTVQYEPSGRTHHIFLPKDDAPHEVIYPSADKDPRIVEASHSAYMEAIHLPNVAPTSKHAGQFRQPRQANTEAITSTVPQRPQKRPKVMTDRELIVSLHQKQDKHHDWLKR
jgi:hypothetical protein